MCYVGELNAIAEISARTLVSIIRAPRTENRSPGVFSFYGGVYIMAGSVIVSLGEQHLADRGLRRICYGPTCHLEFIVNGW